MNKNDLVTQAQRGIKQNPALNPVWVDGINIFIRTDDVCYLQLLATLPDGVYEQFKCMTNKNELKNIIDVLCASAEYFPSKKKKEPAKKKANKVQQ
ncbi:MAG: hypothetical protein PHD82_01970 [Candidatus Riflebacteria bacterium]|nr:hypothetical protein [Candidatus Riflebacteria bacterium]